MEGSPSRLRNARGVRASRSSPPESPESRYGEGHSTKRRSIRAAEHSREQVQSALDDLLSDNEDTPSSHNFPVESAGSPVPRGRRQSQLAPQPITVGMGSTRDGQSSSALLSPGGQSNPSVGDPPTTKKPPGIIATDGYTPTASGYTPTASAGRRSENMRSLDEFAFPCWKIICLQVSIPSKLETSLF